MKIKYKLILPVLIATTACSNGDSAPISLTGETANAIKLLAGSTAVAKSDSELLAVDFDNSAVGSTVTATSLSEISDVTIKVLSPVGGNKAISISGTDSDQQINSVITSDNINLYLQADIATRSVDLTNEDPTPITVNGTKINISNGNKVLNKKTQIMEGYMTIASEDGDSVSGLFRYAVVGDENAAVLGFSSAGDGVFTAPTTGSYTYSGPTVLFADLSDYTSNNSEMSVDFANLRGSYSADTFIADEEGKPLTIKLASDIALNNTTGAITGSNGTIKIGGTSNEMELIGIMNVGNEAVAGAVVVNDSTKSETIVGGVFGLTKKSIK